MTFSREPYQTAISRSEKIETRENAYFRQRLKHDVFSRLLGLFVDRAERFGVTKAKLAMLTGKDPAVINRLLSLPSNLTLETISDLSLALGYEPEVIFHALSDVTCHNYAHPWMLKYQQSAKEPVDVARYARPVAGSEASLSRVTVEAR
jgi:hypothetical protein